MIESALKARTVWLVPLLALIVSGMSVGRTDAAAGLRVRVVDQMTDIRTEADVEEGAVASGVLRMVGPRNGVCSGQAVVTGPDAATVSASLSAFEGPGELPADAATLTYATKGPRVSPDEYLERYMQAGTPAPFFDSLHPEPPEEADVLPVWVTVRIPADAAPGRYTASLEVGGETVPVQLDVGRWVCPAPRDWVTHVGMEASPESVALQYGVPLWSEQHWALIEQSLRLLGGLGNDALRIPVLAENHYGQEHGWVRFRKEGDRFEPDFSVVDRYMDLYARHMGEPQCIMVHVWDSWYYRYIKRGQRRQSVPVTILREDGSVENEKVFPPGSDDVPSDALWRSVMEGLRERVVARGWEERNIALSLTTDQRPHSRTLAFFNDCAPYAGWAIFTHGAGDPKPTGRPYILDGMRIVYYITPYKPNLGYPRESGIMGGWDLAFPKYTTMRTYFSQYTTLSQWRNLAYGVVMRGGTYGGGKYQHLSAAGFAQIGLDYWPVDGGRTLFATSPRKNPWRNMYRDAMVAVTAPGERGPIRTVRYEMLREGLQECEARIAIEKALVAGTVEPALAEECVELLKKRIDVQQKEGKLFTGEQKMRGRTPGDFLWGVSPRWQDLSQRLFDLAGRVDGS